MMTQQQLALLLLLLAIFHQQWPHQPTYAVAATIIREQQQLEQTWDPLDSTLQLNKLVESADTTMGLTSWPGNPGLEETSYQEGVVPDLDVAAAATAAADLQDPLAAASC